MMRLSSLLKRLRRDRRGVALVEFAYATPLLLALGMYGIESANLALTHLRVSQAAANLADNVSRVGEMNALGVKTLREIDINDAFAALRRQSTGYGLTTNGRVILSSLERNATGGQWIHWQRCVGQKVWTSSFGVAGAGATGTALPGMGPAGQEIQAPALSGVMFVEIAYDYQPLISNSLLGAQLIKSRAAFIVRDKRNFDNPNNPSNPSPAATAASCLTYSS
jgi:hypothetical protein